MSIFGRKTRSAEGNEISQQAQLVQPQSDTLDLVPVAWIERDLVITARGKFVYAFEFSAVSVGAGGAHLGQIQERYARGLATLPPGTKYQLTIIPEPVDSKPDLTYFLEKSDHWAKADALQQQNTHDINLNAAALEKAARDFMSLITLVYDSVRPITWRMILTITYTPPFHTQSGFFQLMSKGNGSLSVDSPREKLPAARDFLDQQGRLIYQAFSSQGLELRQLSGPGIAQAVWRVLHPEATGAIDSSARAALDALIQNRQPPRKTAPDLSLLAEGSEPERIADRLAPDNVGEKPDMLFVDGVYLRGFCVYDFDPERPSYIDRLMKLPGGFTGTVFVHVEDPAEIAGRLKTRETALKGMSNLRSQKGIIQSFSGNHEAIGVENTRAKMEMGLETPISIHFFLFVTATDIDELERRSRNLESTFQTLGVRSYRTTHNQLHAWLTTLPLGNIAVKQEPRNMTPGSLKTFFWPPRERLFEKGGRYMGFDIDTGTPVYINPLGERDDRSPTLLAVGKMGGGKSVWLRLMMLVGLMEGHSVFAVDLEGEMRKFVKQYGGRYVDVGTESGDRLNVLDIPPGDSDPLIAGIEQLVAFTSTVMGREIRHGTEWNLLAEAYEYAVKERIGSTSPSDWNSQKAPILSDVADFLVHMGPEGESLAAGLKPYSHGVYAKYFNTLSTLDIARERFVVFGLANIHKSGNADVRLRAYLWQVLSVIWSETVRRHREDLEHITDVFMDEVWALLKAPGGPEAIENMARRYRKRHGILWMATQEMDEFLMDEVGRKILKIVGNTILMSQTKYAADDLQKILHLPDYIRDHIIDMRSGLCVMITPFGMKRVDVKIPANMPGVINVHDEQ